MISLVKPFKRYLGKDAVYNFLNMTEESKYCSEVMKEPFNNKLVTTKEDHEILKTLLNVGVVTVIILIMTLK